MFPNHPFIIPGLIERSITVSEFPSSIPVNWACSDFFSSTFIFSIILAGRFFVANCGSSRKKVLPSIVILLIVLPFAVIEPSLATSIPGNFFRSVSNISPSVTLNEDALYSMVSFLTMIGLARAETVMDESVLTSSFILILPKSIRDFPIVLNLIV